MSLEWMEWYVELDTKFTVASTIIINCSTTQKFLKISEWCMASHSPSVTAERFVYFAGAVFSYQPRVLSVRNELQMKTGIHVAS